MPYGCHVELFTEVRNGCSDRRKSILFGKLVKQYSPKMHKLAHGYTIDHKDAYTCCLEGMYDAFLKYDHRLGVDFLYYSIGYMRSNCQKAYRNNRVIHIPNQLLQTLETLNRKKVLDKPEYELSEDEKTKIASISDILGILSCSALDAPINEYNKDSKNSHSISDMTSQNTFVRADDALSQIELVSILKKYLKMLSKEEREAVILFNGLFNQPELNCREIGAKIGCSHQGARNRHVRALAKLKNILIENQPELFESFDLVASHEDY